MSDAFVQVQPDGAGKKLQTFRNTVGADSVDAEAVVLVDQFGVPIATQPISGTVAVSNFPATQPVSGPLTDTQLRASAVPVSGTFFQATQPISAAALPLPAGASTDRATAAAPGSVELSDGAAFYTAAKTGQLPAALDGSGFLKTHEQGTAAISAAALPLPTGASTEATLVTAKNTLASIDSKLGLGSSVGTVDQGAGGGGFWNITGTVAQGAAAAVTAGWPIKFQLPTAAALTSASVSVAASGDNSLVAGVAAKTTRVFKMLLVFAAACTAQFKDAAAGTALTGAMTMAAGGSILLDFDGEPWFTSAVAGAFTLNLSAAVQVSGRIYYTQL